MVAEVEAESAVAPVAAVVVVAPSDVEELQLVLVELAGGLFH